MVTFSAGRTSTARPRSRSTRPTASAISAVAPCLLAALTSTVIGSPLLAQLHVLRGHRADVGRRGEQQPVAEVVECPRGRQLVTDLRDVAVGRIECRPADADERLVGAAVQPRL